MGDVHVIHPLLDLNCPEVARGEDIWAAKHQSLPGGTLARDCRVPELCVNQDDSTTMFNASNLLADHFHASIAHQRHHLSLSWRTCWNQQRMPVSLSDPRGS